jgi:NADH-quinone oxidoreductase subunit M
MAFVTGGLFAFNTQGLEGAMVVMLSHGVVSAALFFCVGVIYERLHTREIDRYGGLAINMPRYALFFMVFTMASIALPGTSGFVGEFLALTGIFKADTWVAFVMATGVILGAAYMLWLYARVVFGKLVHADAAAMPDLGAREWTVMVPLALVALWMGVYPKPFMDPLRAPVASLMARLDRAQPPQTPFTPLNVSSPARAQKAEGGPA